MKKYSIHEYFLFFLWFPLCRGEAGLLATPMYGYIVICFHWSPLLAFSVHFSSSSAFLRSLFTQSSHLSCGLARFLQPCCIFLSDLFRNLSSFILTMYIPTYGRIKYLLVTLTYIPVIASVTRILWSGIRPDHGDSTDRPWARIFFGNKF